MIMAVFEYANRTHSLKVGKYLIGRDADEVVHDIAIEDRSVDIKHAIFEVTSSGTKILDLHSKHGTYINGTRIDWMIFTDVPKKATIKIGDIQCKIRPTSEHDSENVLNNTDEFEIIPETPQQTGRNNLNNALNDSVVNSSFLVPNTQYGGQRKSYENIFDISVQRNIKEMEEQDEYYIPETQEVFHKPLGLSEISKDELIRINEESSSSDMSTDLLQDLNASIPIPIIRHSPVRIPEFITKESVDNDKEISARLCNNNDNDDKRSDDDDETDGEAEMSTLKWQDSYGKNKSNAGEKSASVTPDLDLDEIANINANVEQTRRSTKSVDDVRSTSVTPELDLPNVNSSNIDKGDKIDDVINDKSNEGPSNTINKNSNTANMDEEHELRSTSVTPDFDLEPTQPFVYHPPVNKTLQNPVSNTSSNVSPSNKENNSNLAQKNTSDLEQTQKFFSNIPQKDIGNLDRTQVFCGNVPHKNASLLDKTQPFIIPTSRVMNSSKDKSPDGVSTPLKTKSVVKDLFSNEDDESLLPTQAFEFKRPNFLTPSLKPSSLRPRSPSPLLLDSDEEENNSEFCLKETLVVGEDPLLETSSKLLNDKNPGKSNNNKTKESRKNKILSSSEDESDKEADNIEVTKTNHGKNTKTTTKSPNKSTKSATSSTKSTPVTKTSSFDFDFLTPACDFINLPDINKIKEAGKDYSRVIEKKKISKTLLEETSSEDEEDSDDVFKTSYKKDKTSSTPYSSVNVHKKAEIKEEKSPKKLKDIKEEKPDKKLEDKNMKSKNNQVETRKKSKLTKIDEKKDEKPKSTSKDDATTSTKLNVSNTSKKNDIKDTTTTRSKNPIEDSKSTKTRGAKVLLQKQDLFKDTEKSTSLKVKTDNHKKISKSQGSSSSKSSKSTTATETITKNTRSKKSITEESEEMSETNEDAATTSRVLPARRGARLRSMPSHLAHDYYVKEIELGEKKSVKDDNKKEKKKVEAKESSKIKGESVERSKNKSRKRSSGDGDYEQPANKTSKSSSEDTPPTSAEPVLRKSSRKPKPRVLFTKVDDAPHRPVLRKHDVEIVSNLRDCTIVISDKIYRTWKLLGGVAKGLPIVSTSWITALENMQKDEDIPNYHDFLIKDAGAEERFQFSLKESLERANRTPIFKDFCFLITKNTEPSPSQLKEIIRCGKGEILNAIPTTIKDGKKVVAISDKRDSHHWSHFRRAGIQIVSTEAIMISALQQTINFNKYSF